ncbi:hypothetical protein QVD99_007434 [Batrachochytrium dendrobatidis]|nr:hypothetical protein O5D80_008404 [Batrachochytrium dendrobatidis]KAK5665802.1 hypothetical protein QVD99_007434 [Batrachochytrium dendrobatidis]
MAGLEKTDMHTALHSSSTNAGLHLSNSRLSPGKSGARQQLPLGLPRSGQSRPSDNPQSRSRTNLTGDGSMSMLYKSNSRLDEPLKIRSGIQRQSFPELKRVPGDGRESEREPHTTGCLKWRFSKTIETEIYSVKFSFDDEFIVAACGNASINVFSTRTNARELELIPSGMKTILPCTSLAFRPDNATYKNKSILVAAYADGSIRHWHYTTGQLLSTINEPDNQINGVSYSRDGSQFVTCGSDMHVRVYDGQTHALTFSAMSGHNEVTAGHSNRIFCVKHHPKDPNMLISGGWDNTLQIWDKRMRTSVKSFFGPHVCGDAIDFNEDGSLIVVGAYVKDNPLTIWSWSTGRMMEAVTWAEPVDDELPMCMLYSAQYSQNTQSTTPNRYILAGGGGLSKEARIFSNDSKKPAGSITHLNSAVYSTAISSQDKMVAIGGGGKTLIVCNIEDHLADIR